MAEILKDTIGDNLLLGNDFSNENHGTNFGEVKINDLMGKIAIIVDKTNTKYQHTALDEYVNMASNSLFMRSIRNYQVANEDQTELKKFNETNMTMTMPDVTSTASNITPSVAMRTGCQMIGMCYQTYDTNMKDYEAFFEKDGHAFVLVSSF